MKGFVLINTRIGEAPAVAEHLKNVAAVEGPPYAAGLHAGSCCGIMPQLYSWGWSPPILTNRPDRLMTPTARLAGGRGSLYGVVTKPHLAVGLFGWPGRAHQAKQGGFRWAQYSGWHWQALWGP